MPARYRNKIFQSNSVYHIYNKGIDGRIVFQDEVDFVYFEKLLARYLGEWRPVHNTRYKSEKPYLARRKQEMNLHGQVSLIAYCLMPNHFHLLVRQQDASGITKLIRRVLTNYVMYFNQRHSRRGMLFEGPYRAVMVEESDQILAVSRLIHLNAVNKTIKRFGPVETITTSSPEQYMYSSYRDYLGPDVREWIAVSENLNSWDPLLLETGLSYRQYVAIARRETDGVLEKYILD